MSLPAPAPETRKPPADEEAAAQYPGWIGAEVEGRPVWFWIAVGLLIAAATLGFGAWWTFGLDRGMGGEPIGAEGMASTGLDVTDPESTDTESTDTESTDMAVDAPRVPPVLGFYDGQAVAFAHTEASDPAVAEMLTDMMGSPVPVVASLGRVDPDLLATVVVFANGVTPQDLPAGPFGFQPDVFDTAPGDRGYTPLRSVVIATWREPEGAELLRSMEEVEDAINAGLLELEDTGAVINAPFLTWPGGQR